MSFLGTPCKAHADSQELDVDMKADKYRTADGSNNNIQLPHLGKAGSYYARTVTPKHIPTSRPDAGLLFDTLLAREGVPTPHPTKISSLLFALADVIIHDVFHTSDRDKDVVETSSYLDLAPLYGSDQRSQDTVRTFAEGRLKPDAFSEVRFMNQPPEVCRLNSSIRGNLLTFMSVSALLICFNRFHNHVVEQLALINEGGRFDMPQNTEKINKQSFRTALAKRDNDLFQTARLVTTGLYVQIVLNDYVRTILNLQRTESSWNLDPRVDVEEILGMQNIDKATGNQVSVEFNLIYRWHSTISSKGERWLNDHLSKIFQIANPKGLTFEQMRVGMRNFAAKTPADPGQRTFGGLQRNAQGQFGNADLVRILTEAAEDVAASFGPRQIPIALKVIEVLSIEQARSWGVASLNEVRKFFGLMPYKTFNDINSDPEIAAALEALYGDVENVELYPGVLVEEAKIPMTPGSGLCAGFTTTRAILSDALALVRGDRFFNVDYTPQHLTSFGFKEASNDISVAGGGVMHKLLQRAFRR